MLKFHYRMLSCPDCLNKLERYSKKVTFAEVEGWICDSCKRFYRTDKLLDSILTV